jgi:hypothetical protein
VWLVEGDRVFVFGNGTRFVWHGGGTQEEHVVQGALVIQMKASLVTVHEAERGFGGEIDEGIGYAIQSVAGGLSVRFIFKHAGFESPGTAEAPVGSDHFLDHAELHAIGGLQANEVIVEDRLETLGRFVAHDDLTGKESVSDGILRRISLALSGDRAG